MMRRRVFALVGAVAWSLGWVPPSVEAWQGPSDAPPHGSVEADIRAQVAGVLGTEATGIRLELQDADADVASLAGEADSVTVRRGSGDLWILTSWTGGAASARFVRVGIADTVAVATRDLPRGHTLAAEDVTWREQVRWGAGEPGLSDPVGQVTERGVRAGELLAAPAVRPPLVVRGGEAVEAVFDEGAVRMSLRATALASARAGGRLPVRLENGRRFEATAVERGVVRLRLGSGS